MIALGCHKRQLNQALSALLYYPRFFWVHFVCSLGPLCLYFIISYLYVFCLFIVLVRLSEPLQVIDLKDSSEKWPVMCWWEDGKTLLTSYQNWLPTITEFFGGDFDNHVSCKQSVCSNFKLQWLLILLFLFSCWCCYDYFYQICYYAIKRIMWFVMLVYLPVHVCQKDNLKKFGLLFILIFQIYCLLD